MPKTVILVGPNDHGQPMSLDEFEFAEVQEGHRYELSRGVIVVSDIPDPVHGAQVYVIRNQIGGFCLAHPDRVTFVGAGFDCKLLVLGTDSERHPDISIYKSPRPRGKNPWRTWIPEIVVEIVSLSSQFRDYEEKREDYWALGVKEYWIVDAERREMLVLRRHRGKWSERVLGETDTYTTRLLPGFLLELAPVFAAADAAQG